MSSSLSVYGTRKITLSTEAVTPSSEPKEKYAYTKIRFDDGAGSEITEVSAFRCNGITIEDADKLNVFFVKDDEGKVRLEVSIPDSSLGIGDVERTNAKTILDCAYPIHNTQEQ